MSFERATLRRFLAENRIYFLLVLVYACMSLATPYFPTLLNQTSIMKTMSFSLPAAIGFTLVMICGHLDLTIGTNLSLGGVLAVGLQPQLGWTGAIAVALFCGILIGLINGLLVTKIKVDAFIVTLGMMTATQGAIYIFCKGNTVSTRDLAIGQWMDARWPLFPPRVIIAIALVLLFEFLMKRTRAGRNVYLVGGNAHTAWTSGVAVDGTVIGAFIISGMLATLGGALFSIGLGSAMPTQGSNSLMEVIAAVIIGGTSMSGGKGSVFKSMIALLTLTALYSGLECLGAGWEIHKIAGGGVLGAVVLYDAFVAARQRRLRGRRHELLAELQNPETFEKYASKENSPEDERSEEDEMNQKNSGNALAIVVVGCVACVAIVAIFAMYFLSQQQAQRGAFAMAAAPSAASSVSAQSGSSAQTASSPAANPAGRAQQDLANAEAAINAIKKKAEQQKRALTQAEEEEIVALLRSDDGQPLILPDSPKPVPPRPEVLPASEDDPMHWYDLEFAGWGIQKVNLPKSPATGARGKRVIFLKATDHPYHTALTRGLKKVADVYGITVDVKTADGTPPRQNQQVDQAINEKPDLVIISPVEAKASVSMLKRLNEAGIPVIAINLLPEQEGHKYILAWTGPNDWGQFRLMSRKFAELMPKNGKYCIVQHFPGWSPFFARTYAVTTELKKIRPDLQCLEMQPTGLEAERTRDVVAGWLTQYGKELNGIVSCDDAGAQVGINQAIKNAGREDIIRIAAGNSKVGMDFVKEGRLHAITYQSPEADGAIPMKLAADWFYGKPIPPIRYLPVHIITKVDVENYMPAQW